MIIHIFFNNRIVNTSKSSNLNHSWVMTRKGIIGNKNRTLPTNWNLQSVKINSVSRSNPQNLARYETDDQIGFQLMGMHMKLEDYTGLTITGVPWTCVRCSPDVLHKLETLVQRFSQCRVPYIKILEQVWLIK